MPPQIKEEVIARLLAEAQKKSIIDVPGWASVCVFSLRDGDEGPGRFAQREFWRIEIGHWSHDVATYAVRRSSDESLEFRLWHPPVELLQARDGYPLTTQTQVVTPMFGNWHLLAICQTIIALPLVLAWVALRWRRKRRLRIAGTAS